MGGSREWSQSPGPAAVPAMLYTYLWLSLSGAVHTLPLPSFIGAMNQARNGPVRPMGILQGPHSPLLWVLPRADHAPGTLSVRPGVGGGGIGRKLNS